MEAFIASLMIIMRGLFFFYIRKMADFFDYCDRQLLLDAIAIAFFLNIFLEQIYWGLLSKSFPFNC